ncbi:TMEM1 family protein-like protein [Lepidopterella palustris CBS 459.81]|uniref:TMEM1 family protein-like protein n=1 Tax=Lepidopterella palustris CBS 459.81 TaxID=1314670 RepID=A0A8E2E688_9PEZI|nr:TMEM1 family protein-like protein [Lepidopterella palustris CBS 459.81]
MNTARDAARSLGAAEDEAAQFPAETDVMDGSSSSKVTVEYYDPSGVFPLLSEQLISRLPLRNLHWKSPTRPLRSIDSLHVDLVPSKDTPIPAASVSASVLQPGLSSADDLQRTNSGQGHGSASSTAPSSEFSRVPTKERRHQIPGLRQTPYLKVYLLRCDDPETYKASSRKLLREWVREHTPPSQSSTSSSTQENHDAFEWIILHVVLPNTVAASQPRGSGAANTNAGASTEKSSGSSRWTRGSSTLFEKIRADFNISSKTAPDRIAQVRLQKDAVPPHMLPSGSASVGSPFSESLQEQNNAWNDVITKFKTLILLSFDLRVSQYEEDIREKDSQRALPGWNFCTFFILKEGLARGFESVGLVEDALVGYDELSVGLDSVIRDQAGEISQNQGGSFLQYTEELQQQISALQGESGNTADEDKIVSHHLGIGDKPINSAKKSYRDLILSNNISVFDFRCYIFSRQMSLLLRLGNAHSSRSELTAKLHVRPSTSVAQRSVDDSSVGTKSSHIPDSTEDLISLAELCHRALIFVTSAARLLSNDVKAGVNSKSLSTPEALIDNFVSSWTFAAAQQILDETSTLSLPASKYLKDAGTGSSGKMRSFGGHDQELKVNLPEPKTMIHPTRSSSLSHRRTSLVDPPYAQTPPSGQVVYDHGRFEDRPPVRQEAPPLSGISGLQDLAANRAKLYIVQRRVLEHVGKRCGWAIGWAAIASAQAAPNESFSEVDLDAPTDTDTQREEEQDETQRTVLPTLGLCEAALIAASSSVEQFRALYERLSDLSVKHYMAAGQSKSAESILGDLAALKFELGDYAAAAMYFHRMAPLFAENRWNYVETTMLKMYAQCLKKLNRKDEYVRTLLDLLAKSAAERKTIRLARASLQGTSIAERIERSKTSGWLDDDKVDTAGFLTELIDYSNRLPYDVTVPMSKYFGDITVEPYVRHYDDKDGFQLRLQFRHLLEDDIVIQKARVRLISAVSGHSKEIWLESENAMNLRRGMARTWLNSNINTCGPYVVDRILIEASKIIFLHEPFTKAEAPTPLGITMSVSAASLRVAKKSRVLCFPRMEAFQAKLSLSHYIHIDQPRSIEIQCSSGWNDILKGEVRLRSASAGLRLRTARSTLVSGETTLNEESRAGSIDFSHMPNNTIAVFRVPYDLENVLSELVIKLEIEYFTEKGQFQFFSSSTIPIDLPLDVNVHDHFKGEALFSRFNIKTATNSPLEVLDVNLEGSDLYTVQSHRKLATPMYVFQKQPVSITYRISTKTASAKGLPRTSQGPNQSPSLALTVDYRCLSEDVVTRAEAIFAAAIEGSPLHRLGRLLVPSFLDRLKQRILPSQSENITLLDRVNLGAFDGMPWNDCVESLPHVIREDTRTWLRKWHENHPFITLTNSDQQEPKGSSRPFRRIVITVSIPRTHIVHTASLTLLHQPTLPRHSPPIAAVGKMLMAELRIKHTRRWGTPESLKSAAGLADANAPIDFVYDVEANTEVWLVAGQRRMHFSAREDETEDCGDGTDAVAGGGAGGWGWNGGGAVV